MRVEIGLTTDVSLLTVFTREVFMEPSDVILDNLVQELKRGTLVLSVLLATEQPVYGYALVSSLQERGVEVEQNTLYPLLRRLEKQGLLDSSWETGEARPRRYYVISPQGKSIRRKLFGEWETMNKAIHAMEGTP